MKILIENFVGMETDKLIAPAMRVTADLPRPDLVIDSIANAKGDHYVLDAVGLKVIKGYMELNGYVVVDVEATVNAA